MEIILHQINKLFPKNNKGKNDRNKLLMKWWMKMLLTVGVVSSPKNSIWEVKLINKMVKPSPRIKTKRPLQLRK